MNGSNRSSRSSSFDRLDRPFAPVSSSTSRDRIESPQLSSRGSSTKSLRVFVGLPTIDVGKGSMTLSPETLEGLARITVEAAAKEREAENGDEPRPRPPSPVPADEQHAVVLHSENLQDWEDAIRFSFMCRVQESCLASGTYTRTASLHDSPPQFLKSLRSCDD
jgi:hypothetical protein